MRVPRSYKGALVIVSDSAPGIHGDLWLAHWSWSITEEVTIYLERKYVEAASAHMRQDVIDEALEHEWLEAGTALYLASMFVEPNNPMFPSVLDSVGGTAHSMTIHTMNPDETEKAYNRRMVRELVALGLIDS